MIPHPADGFKPVEMLPMWKCCQYLPGFAELLDLDDG
jgi:hypothetical protein